MLVDTGTNLRPKTKKAKARPSALGRRISTRKPYPKSHTSSFWTEALFGAEILILHATPVYYGLGVPRGDDSAVVIIPGFLGTDLYLTELHAWLGRIGYWLGDLGDGLSQGLSHGLGRSGDWLGGVGGGLGHR